MKAEARIIDSKVRSIRTRKTRNLADSNKLNGLNESFLERIKSIKSEVVDFYWLMLYNRYKNYRHNNELVTKHINKF